MYMLDVQSLIKYLLEGAAVAVAAYYIPRRTANPREIAMIALTAAAVFAVLDTFAPAVSGGARQGAGFGIGYNITHGLEGLEGPEGKEGKDADSDSESSDSNDSEEHPVEPNDNNVEHFSAAAF
jgi:hypothetical protein